MHSEQLARFYQLCGRHVELACDAFWANMNLDSRLFMSVSHYATLKPDPDELDRMLRRASGIAARFPCEGPQGHQLGMYVLRDRSYCLESLDRKRRNAVRRGLAACDIRPLDPDELARYALPLNIDSMNRQGRMLPEFCDLKWWAKVVEAVRRVPAIRTTGAFIGGQLAAYAIEVVEDGWVSGLHQFSKTEFLPYCPNHALDYWLARRAMSEPGILAISNGPVPLVRDPGLHLYKTRLGYEVLPQQLAVHFRPALRMAIVNRPAEAFVNVASRCLPRSRILASMSCVISAAQTQTRCTPDISGLCVS
jgi:hypothetical protein